MAKRKRLTPARFMGAEAGGIETKSALSGGPAAPPIAAVAGEAAAASALSDLSRDVAEARAGGRMIVDLPLDAVEAGYLVRDRVAVSGEDAAALTESLRARGQQTPIEVTDLGGGRYGLISGWRRLTALRQLHEETGAPRFAHVQALLRRPEEASDAYLAMVEENEIRAGLSHYERARVAVRAAEAGVFPDTDAAIAALFAAGSRARRSKIRSFLPIVAALDGALRHPQAIGERLGLRLSKALEADPALGPRIAAGLRDTAPGDAAEEQTLLETLMQPSRGPAPPAPMPRVKPGQVCTLTRDVRLKVAADGSVMLYGPGVTDAFRTRLLKAFGAAGAD